MLTEKEKGLLIKIINHCKRIEDTVKDLTKEEFDQNYMIKDALCFNLLQIGELAKKFEPNFVKEYGNAPWKNIKGMRDRIVHGYDSLLFDEVWKTSTTDVIPLHEYCHSILGINKTNRDEAEELSAITTFDIKKSWDK